MRTASSAVSIIVGSIRMERAIPPAQGGKPAGNQNNRPVGENARQDGWKTGQQLRAQADNLCHFALGRNFRKKHRAQNTEGNTDQPREPNHQQSSHNGIAEPSAELEGRGGQLRENGQTQLFPASYEQHQYHRKKRHQGRYRHQTDHDAHKETECGSRATQRFLQMVHVDFDRLVSGEPMCTGG